MIQTSSHATPDSCSESTHSFLSSLHKGETGTVVGLCDLDAAADPDSDSSVSLKNRLAGMGVFPGVPITVLRSAANSSRPTLLAIGDTRIALGPEIVSKIEVKK